MKFIQRLFSGNGAAQAGNRNREALRFLRELGFPIERIRKALFDLNGIRITGPVGPEGPSTPAIYSTLKGIRTNPLAKQMLAERLGLSAEEIFPPEKACQPRR